MPEHEHKCKTCEHAVFKTYRGGIGVEYVMVSCSVDGETLAKAQGTDPQWFMKWTECSAYKDKR